MAEATTDQLDRIIGKLMIDHTFRMSFSQNPGQAAKELGITLSKEQEDSFKKNITAFHGAAGELERGASHTAEAAGHVAAIFKQATPIQKA
jgi:hypothetical protein